MSFSLEQFKTDKQQLNNKFSQLSFILKELKQHTEVKQIGNMMEQLDRDTFQVVVVGEFSRGKSMFINALLGEGILPTSAKPTTTCLNKIEYSDEPTFFLHYQEASKSRKITREEFSAIVAPRQPIPGDNESQSIYDDKLRDLESINYAAIGYPVAFCEEGVTIVDTPGINDLNAAREQITNNFIPNADVAIVLLSAIKILSESEMSFLRDRILASDIQKIFIVINFKDNLNSVEDENTIIDYAKEKLEDLLPNIKLYLVTSKEALHSKRKANGEIIIKRGQPIDVWDFKDTGFMELEADLASFLQNERGTIRLQKPIKRVNRIIRQTIFKQLKFEKLALQNSTIHLMEKATTLRYKLQFFRNTGIEALKMLEFDLHKQQDDLMTWYPEELTKISNSGMDSFESNVYRLSLEELPSLVEKTIAPLERSLHVEKSQKLEHALRTAVKTASNKLNDDWAMLDQEFQEIFSSPDNENGFSLASLQQELAEETNGIVFFEDLIEELENANRNSDSMIGKIASGVGIGLSVIVYGVFAIGRSIFSSFLGNDKKTKLKSDIRIRLNDSKRNKMNAFKNEWAKLSEGVKQQYEININVQVEKMEQQLQLLIDNTQLEESEIAAKMHWIENKEHQLQSMLKDLSAFEGNLHYRKNVDREVLL